METEEQIERLNECFSLLGETARAKPCKGMMGLVEEGQEVMEEGAGEGRRACRPRPDRRGAAGRALRDFRLHDRQEPGPATAPQRRRGIAVKVPGGGRKLRSTAQSGGPELMSVAQMPAAVERIEVE